MFVRKLIQRQLVPTLNRLNRITAQYGLHFDELLRLRYLPKDLLRFRRNKRQYFSLVGSSESGSLFKLAHNFPCLSDHRDTAGKLPKHYFQQDIHIAREIFLANPTRHIDVGSRIDGFVAHVAVFREIEVVDIRAMDDINENIKFLQLDITDRNSVPHEICDSLSCLHTIEHIGLGRYGDIINPDGWLIALDNLLAMLKLGGILYLSAPIGEGSIEFDAHRLFSLSDLLETLSQRASITKIEIIDDNDQFMSSSDCDSYIARSQNRVKYGCALITARKH